MIDVTNWQEDDEHRTFPIGAREKKMLRSPDTIKENSIKPNWPYLFKLSRDAYPDQFWMETVAYLVGEYCQISVPRALPAFKTLDDGSKEFGALLEWFYDPGNQLFIHASDLFRALNKNFNNETGCDHNLEDLFVISRFTSRHNEILFKNWESWLCEMLLFDALIGNTDRHQENWGMVSENNKELVLKWVLAPLYDNGTSLGHERFPNKVTLWNRVQLDKYIKKGCHHIRKKRNDTKRKLNHLESINYCVKNFSCTNLLKERLNFDIQELVSSIELLCKIDAKEFSFTKERASWVTRLLKRRYQILTLLLNMRTIKNFFEPSTLFLTWQPLSGGSRYVVARIDKKKNSYTFTYCPDSSDYKQALEKGFKGYPAFRISSCEHKNNVLEPFISRLPPRKRKDFGDYLEQHFLPRDYSGSDFTLLAYTGAKSPADGFSLVIDPKVIESQHGELLLEVAGTRYQTNIDLSKVSIGDSVTLVPEPENPEDKNAIMVLHEEAGCLGYINKVLCKSILKKLTKNKITAFVARTNGTPERPLIYILLEVDQ
ncbi:HIRAN domain-containing protein [Arsenophonus nasoniae]|uniref:HIRAN domain-containing protein n=1 Tax=Arsenophonus nasoniae TaxID=638 RepID=UPI003879633E